jgi:hypothetical protein
MFKISQEDRQKLLNYLKGRPYEEVFTLIALIVGLKPLENGKKKEEDKKDN